MHKEINTKTGALFQLHTYKLAAPESIMPKLLFGVKKVYAYMYIIITFHISSKIHFHQW